MNLFRWMQGCLGSALVFFWGPYIYNLWIVGESGASFAFTGTYWAIAAGACFFTVVAIRYIRHPFGLVGAMIMELLYGWLSFGLWAPPIVWWKNRILGVGAVIWGASCLLGFALSFYLIRKRKKYLLDWPFSWRKLEQLAIIFCVMIGFFWWAYGGFGQFGQMRMKDLGDKGPSYFKVSFWGLPSGGLDPTAYNSSAGTAELAAYQALNSTFYVNVTGSMLNDSVTREALTSVIQILAQWNLTVVINVQPTAKDGQSDYVGYYNLNEVQNTTAWVLKWRNDSQLWNIIGLCFDAETPRDSINPDYIAYYRGVTQMAVIINMIQESNSTLRVTVFGIASKVFNTAWTDEPNMDFLQMTVTTPPTNWDRFGFKTFRSGPKNWSSYYTYIYQNFAVQTYGADRSVPVLGQAGAGNYALREGDNGFHEITNDLLLCKYLGVPEVIIDSAEGFTKSYTAGQNGSARLSDLRVILDEKPVLVFQITNDWDLFGNPSKFVANWNFDIIYPDADLFKDLTVTNGGMFTALFVFIFTYFIVKGIAEKRTPRKPRPSFMSRIRERRGTNHAELQ